MATVRKRRKKDGSFSYTAHFSILRKGHTLKPVFKP
ncbi:hypothetical protein BDK62_10429 [Halomonas alkaliantarctica]|nr:hypothetical protein BDK62_10429 [Halomonas alkaliantarctica]